MLAEIAAAPVESVVFMSSVGVTIVEVVDRCMTACRRRK